MRNKEEESNKLILATFNEINQASRAIIDKWRQGQQKVIDKTNVNGVLDVVTEVDIAIENLTRNLFAEMPVFGEESFENDFSLMEKPLYIVVDPIDGTKEFVKGRDEWSISLCAVREGLPVVASIFMPDKNQHFTAIKGSGLILNGSVLKPSEAGRRRIAVSPRQIMDSRRVDQITETELEPFEVSAFTPKICALLRGEVNSATYFPQEGQSVALWDYAAGVLLVQEAGGRISSLCGNELPFKGEDIIHRKGWLATRDLDHDNILSCLSRG